MPDSLREQLGQLSWFFREYHRPRRWVLQHRATRGLRLPDLPRSRRVPGSIWAVTMVKDEEDVIVPAVRHLLQQGVDHVLVADNMSSDSTPRLLADLAAGDPRVHVAYDAEPAYYQAEKMSRLARVAARGGADWVIPFDADEFWFAQGTTLAAYLRRTDAGIVDAALHHMVPAEPAPADLLGAEFVLDSAKSRPGKVAIRAHRLVTMLPGNHGAARVGAREPGLFIAHALYRSPAQVARKVRQGAMAIMLTDPQDNIGPHWRRASTLDDAAIDRIWDDLSHGRAVPLLDFSATGPMVRVRPLRWQSWDPQHELSG